MPTRQGSARSKSARSSRRGSCRSSPTPPSSLPLRRRCPGLCVSVLVPNLKGAERAIESGADLMLLPLSASHAHSLANLRKTPDDVVREIASDSRGARRSRFALPDRGRHQHGVRLHDSRQGRARRGAAADSCRARRGRRSRGARRHRRLCRSGDGAGSLRARGAHRGGAPRVRPLPRHARARDRQRLRGVADRAFAGSTRASPASAAVRTRRGRAATSRPRTSCISSPAWACRRARTSIG